MNKLQQTIDDLYNMKDDLFANAQAQWLESCLDSDADSNELLYDLKSDTLYWLEEQMNDIDSEDLLPGGIYHWMTVAVAQSENWA